MEQIYSTPEEAQIDTSLRPIYKIAYFQRRMNQIIGVFLLLVIAMAATPRAFDSQAVTILLGLVAIPFFGYAAYCYIRLKALLYTWWCAPLFLLLFIAYPLLIIEMIVSGFVISRRYRECNVPAGWLGVDTKTMDELKAQAGL